jgi:histone deacetylase 1/2
VGIDGLYQFKPFQFTKNTDVKSQVKSNFASTLNKGSIPVFSPFSVLNKGAMPSTSQIPVLHNSVLCNATTAKSKLDSDLHKWHVRLGHAHIKAVQSVLQSCNIPWSNKTPFLPCTICCIGKSHRLYAPISSTIYTKPFEVIHCDLWGPAPFTSYYGYNYYITFVDTFTKYTWIYFLKNKSDAIRAFTQYLALIKNQFQASVKSLQSDWGENLDLSQTYSMS